MTIQDNAWIAAAGLDERPLDCEGLAKMPLAAVLYRVLVSGRDGEQFESLRGTAGGGSSQALDYRWPV